MNEEQKRSSAEAEPLLGVAEKLLQNRDLNGAKDFAVLAQENEPSLEGPEQILAVAEVLLASDRRVTSTTNASLHDWYSILQVPRRTQDLDLVKKQFRCLALLLHPDKNKYPLADQAFRLVTDAWAVLSDPAKKAHFDNETGPFFSKVDLSNSSSSKLPVRRTQPQRQTPTRTPPNPTTTTTTTNNVTVSNVNIGSNSNSNSNSSRRNELVAGRSGSTPFWTVCPYCYVLYEYPSFYENCCLKCQSCERAFHGAVINTMPPLVPGKEAYYCTWGFFPLGFVFAGADGKAPSGMGSVPGFVNWMPNMFAAGQQGGGVPQAQQRVQVQQQVQAQPARGAVQGRGSGVTGTGRKRGRPRKYPIQTT